MPRGHFQTSVAPSEEILALLSELDIKVTIKNNISGPSRDGLKGDLQDSGCTQVLEWRWSLQRAFLNKSLPKEEEMPSYDKLFTIIEQHDLTLEQLAFSKIGKIMRHISLLEPEILRHEEKYHIRDRANALVAKWQRLVLEMEARDD